MFKTFLSLFVLPILYFIFVIGKIVKRKVQELNQAYREEMKGKK